MSRSTAYCLSDWLSERGDAARQTGGGTADDIRDLIEVLIQVAELLRQIIHHAADILFARLHQALIGQYRCLRLPRGFALPEPPGIGVCREP
jgi:hypothetical protein